jgi:hypothetical protein
LFGKHQNTRYALGTMLIVDVICVVTAIFVATWFLNELKLRFQSEKTLSAIMKIKLKLFYSIKGLQSTVRLFFDLN